VGDGGLTDADFAAILDTAVSPYSIVDDDGTVLWVSSSITELTGWARDEIVGHNMLEFLDEPSQIAVVDSLSRFTEASAQDPRWLGVGLLISVVCKDGQLVDCVASSVTSSRTGVNGLVVQMTRGAPQRHLHRAVGAMASGGELHDVLAHLSAMVASEIAGAIVEIAWDWDGDRFADVSRTGVDLLTRDDGTGDRPWVATLAEGESRFHDDVTTLSPVMAARARELGIIGSWIHPVAVGPGEPPTAAVVVWRTRKVDRTSFTTQFVERGFDVVALALQWHRGREALEQEATHDTLTGLANRRALLESLAAPGDGTVLFCDLDKFKPVNDEHGHSVGDRVLLIVGERLERAVRPTDVVARYGGDEFVVHCPGLVGAEEIDGLVARLHDAVAAPIVVDGAVIRIGISIGAAPMNDDAITVAADRMRAAKRRSRM
jgi:diguanylate cyclase (GGDEF)-like protein/PAS domain S-box-containing protein